MTAKRIAQGGRAVRAIRTLAPYLVVIAVAVTSSLSSWSGPVRWASDPDTLYYQAKVLSLRGANESTELHRLFAGPEGAVLRRLDERRPAAKRQFTNPRWINYSSRFFRRRVLVPLLAAALYPLLGERSLLTVSLLGYLLLSLALYALLRRRFSSTVSVLVTCLCILVPPLRRNSFIPMSDSWSILLEICALLTASLTLERGERWLVPWIAALTAASLTRDVTIVPLTGVLCLALHTRTRRAVLLTATGVASVLPALIAFGNASVRENLAFVFSGYNPPRDASWGFVLRNYGPNFRHFIRLDLLYGTHLGWLTPVWFLGILIAVLGALLLIRSALRGESFYLLHAYSLVGAALFLAVYVGYSAFREELVLLPPVAVGLALVARELPRAWRTRRQRLRPRRRARSQAILR